VRVSVVPPGPAADALGILMAFPELGPVADEEGLPQLLQPGTLAELARALIQGSLSLEEAFGRLAPATDEATLRWLRVLTGPGRPERAAAEREFRKAAVKARLARISVEMGEAEKRVARAGTAAVDDVVTEYQRLVNQKRDLQRRLRSLEKPG
jgi:DNA primase